MLRTLSHYKPLKRDINILCLDGGLGDHVGGSLIAINYILKSYRWMNCLIWVPDFLVEFAKNVLPPHACVRSFSDMKKRYNRELPTLSTEWDKRTSPMKISCTDYAFLRLCDEVPPIERKNYLSARLDSIDVSHFKLPLPYVVVVVGFTAGVREFAPEAVNAVSRHCISRGYTPVFLGQRSTATGQKHLIEMKMSGDVDLTLGVDMIDKTSLLQATKIIAGAKALIGVDCGLMHLAGCTETSIVGGYTTVNPELRMPIRHNQVGWNCFPVVPDPALQCRYCQVSTNFLTGHDYKFCLYNDYECVKSLTSGKWIEQLERVL